MPIYAGVLNGNNNNNDYQFQAGISAVLNQGVISGLAVTSGQVGTGSALVSVTRGAFSFLLSVHNTAAVAITTTGTTKVWLAIDQAKIDNNSAGAADGTGVASIQTGASYPGSGSFVKLASITSGTITDEREMLTGKNIFRKGFTANYILDIVNGAEVQKLLSSSSVLNDTDLVRFKDSSGEWKELLWSVIKNGLSTIGTYTQTVQMGEALASSGYGSNITNAFSTAGSNSGAYTTMGGRLQFAQRTKIISAKYPHNASNGSAAIIITDVAGATLGTYAVANGTKEATGINFVCEAGVIYQIGCNTTANFGNLHANYTLTQADIDNGFISGCYANANFDTTWRMQEIVLQKEEPANYAIAVVNNVQYVKSAATTSAGSVVNRGIVFDNAYAGRKLGVVKTENVTNSSSGVIKLQDSTGADIATRTLANGAKSVDFNGTVIGTSYRLVVNDTVNWSSTSYYDTVASYKTAMPFIASGITNGTADTTNAWIFSEINVDYGGKGYKAKKSSILADFDFYLKFAGFASGPKSVGDNVSLTCTKGTVISGFTGLSDGGRYFISNIPGLITLSPSSAGYYVGKGVGTQSIETDPDFLGYTDGTFNTIGSAYCGAYPYPPAQSSICKILKKGTLRVATQTGVNGGNVTGTRLTSVLKNGVSVYSSGGAAGNFDFACDSGDVFVITGYAFQEAGSGSLGGGSLTLSLNDLMRTPKYVTI